MATIFVPTHRAMLEAYRNEVKRLLGDKYEMKMQPYVELVIQQAKRTKKDAVHAANELFGLLRARRAQQGQKLPKLMRPMMMAAALDAEALL